jgi:hypothetical protein
MLLLVGRINYSIYVQCSTSMYVQYKYTGTLYCMYAVLVQQQATAWMYSRVRCM